MDLPMHVTDCESVLGGQPRSRKSQTGSSGHHEHSTSGGVEVHWFRCKPRRGERDQRVPLLLAFSLRCRLEDLHDEVRVIHRRENVVAHPA